MSQEEKQSEPNKGKRGGQAIDNSKSTVHRKAAGSDESKPDQRDAVKRTPTAGQKTAGGATPKGERRARGAGVAIGFAIMALVLALAAGGFAYLLWQRLQKIDHDLTGSLAELRQSSQQSTDTLRNELNTQMDALSRQQTSLSERQQQLEDAVSAMRELAGRDQQQWVLAEVEYLLLIANQRLQLQGDVPTAIAALNMADSRLRDLGDPGLLGVRRTIASEISRLKAVARPDIDGIALNLNGLAGQVDRLALRTTKLRLPTAEHPGAESAPAEHPAWRTALNKVWAELKTLVVIRRHEQPVRPLLGPEEEFLIRQVLTLRLQAARTALITTDETLFRTSLQEARSWLDSRFDQNDPAVVSMAAELQRLESVTIHPVLPDVSGSLRQLREYMAKRSPSAGAPLETGPKTPAGAAPGAAPEAEPGGERSQPPASTSPPETPKELQGTHGSMEPPSGNGAPGSATPPTLPAGGQSDTVPPSNGSGNFSKDSKR
jgi:uroporphyrin-3 C-methyltransferase